MLASGISIGNRLYVVGGVTGQVQKPQALKDIYVFNDETRVWSVWTTMSTSRLNHCTASYGNYLVVVGGHTLHNMVPREVPSASCYNTDSEDREEYFTPTLGSNKLGLGVALVGDQALLGEVTDSGRTVSGRNTSTWSSFSSDLSTKGLMTSASNTQAFMGLFCPRINRATELTETS